VDCASWPEEIAIELFGPDWANRKTCASIKKVTGTKFGRLKFSLEFSELQEVYIGFNWEYIQKYIVDPLPFEIDEVQPPSVKPKKNSSKDFSIQLKTSTCEEVPKSFKNFSHDDAAKFILGEVMNEFMIEDCSDLVSEKALSSFPPLSENCLLDVQKLLDEGIQCFETQLEAQSVGVHELASSDCPIPPSALSELMLLSSASSDVPFPSAAPFDIILAPPAITDVIISSPPASDVNIASPAPSDFLMSLILQNYQEYFCRHHWMKAWNHPNSCLPAILFVLCK